MESLKEDGTVWDTDEGRIVNPGHIFEGMWFCIDEALVDNDKEVLTRALEIIDITYKNSIDKVNGGIIQRFDCFGKATDNKLRTGISQLNADDKVDWVHCEALYTLALVSVLTNDNSRFQNFLDLHKYCQNHFRPNQGGDWYPLLSADGKVLRKNKGGKHRVAFHVPRALMNITLLFRKFSEGYFNS
ncbi:MAG: hypothetical protein GX957_01840 [Clostridiaceae bacterium]|nr:hypothetical protein [Clostridiaceae bacterium]